MCAGWRVRSWRPVVKAAPDRWIRSTTTGCVALLALIAGTMSYLHVHTLGELYGSRTGCWCWRWALTHRTEHGSLPTGREIAHRYGRHQRWGRLVKRAGAAGEFTAAPGSRLPEEPHRAVWIMASTYSELCQTPTQSRHGLRPRHPPGYSSLRGARRMTRSTLSRIPASRSRVQARSATPPTATTIASHGGTRS